MRPDTVRLLGTTIDALDWDSTIARLLGWASEHRSRYVGLCNAHMLVTSARDPCLRAALAQCDLRAPDGAPVAWLVGQLLGRPQPRIAGPDLMLRLLEQAAARALPVYLYGGTPATLTALARRLRARLPALQLAGMWAPPFRPLTAAEDAAVSARITRSGARIVLVGLGCPKLELWMAAHCGRIPALMLGVGAAFDFHAGTLARAPLWWQAHGLEWLFRLLVEPRRLARRYLVTNTLFVLQVARQLLRADRGQAG
jgi:N-acetylglucosaminyldiphosphoundecaprenol N-acetyl-beta-D-mannosaminyltransferase